MSKAVIKSEKKNEVNPQFKVQALQKIKNPPPALREVNLPAINDEHANNVVAVYKDLLQPAKDHALQQRKNLIIGIAVFAILALGILMGQHFSKPRGVAAVDMNKLIPAGAETTLSEHYHYDKSCYIGENGEQVCMTRTSK